MLRRGTVQTWVFVGQERRCQYLRVSLLCDLMGHNGLSHSTSLCLSVLICKKMRLFISNL